MKTFMKKTLSWMLTAAMVCPMIVQSIAFAANADPDYERNQTIDNLELQFENAHKDANGTLSQLHYNLATMYDYDALQFNTAMRDAELSMLTGGIIPSSVYQAGRWNGFYFQTNSDDLDGIQTIFGAELAGFNELNSFATEGYNGGQVNAQNTDTVLDGVSWVVIPDGKYKMGSAWDDATANDRWIVGTKDNSTDPNAGDVLIGGKRENAMVFTFTQIGDSGTYTIQNAEGKYLYANATAFTDAVTNVVKFVDAPDNLHTTFYIYQQANGDFVLKAGNLAGSNWFLCNRGEYISCRGQAIEASSVLTADINTFNLVKVVDFTVSKVETVNPSGLDVDRIVIPDGTYVLDSGRDKDNGNIATFTFERLANNTYYIKNAAGQYLKPNDDGYTSAAAWVDQANAATFVLYQYDSKILITVAGTYRFINTNTDGNAYIFYGGNDVDAGMWKDPGNQYTLTPSNPNPTTVEQTEAYRLYGLSGNYLLRNFYHKDFVKINQDARNDYNKIVDSRALTDLVRTGGATEWTITEVEPGIYTLSKVISKTDNNGNTTSTTYYLAIDGATAWAATESTQANWRNTRFYIYQHIGGANDSPAIVLRAGVYNDAGNLDEATTWTLNVPSSDKNADPYFRGQGEGIVGALTNGGSGYYLYDLTAESDDVFFYEYAAFNTYVNVGNKAFPGIMNDTLVNGAPQLSTGVDLPIFGTAPAAGKEVYENVQVPFVPVKMQGSEGEYTTYVFDSDLYSAYFAGGAASNTTLYANVQQQSTNRTQEPGAWLPFNDSSVATNGVNGDSYKFHKEDGNKQYATDFSYYADYHFGMTLSIPFTMTADGKVAGENMTFNFRGDDDVWVFVDGQLVLDLGGIHDKIGGTIDFAANEWSLDYVDSLQDEYTYYVETPSGRDPMGNNLNTNQVKGAIFTADASGAAATGAKINQTFADFQDQSYHTLTVAYLERGEAASNCRMTYNLLQPDLVTVQNNVVLDDATLTEDEKAALEDLTFTYTAYAGANGETPKAGLKYTILENGVAVGNGVTDANGKFKLENGQTAIFTIESGDMIDDGETMRIVQTKMPGFDKTVNTYDGVAYGSYTINGTKYNGTGSSDSYETFEGTSTSQLESAKISIDGVEEETDEIHFVFNNYYGLSDVIVIDYGLSVGIDLDDLDYWKNNPDYKLSNLVVNGYHNGEQALYGTIANSLPTTTIEAEAGQLIGAASLTNNAEASGGTHVGDIGKRVVDGKVQANEAAVSFTYNSPIAGKATLSLYYIVWGNDRSFGVAVNGGAEQVVNNCIGNGSWDIPAAKPVSITVDLKAGANTIVVSGTATEEADGFAPNLDYITITMQSPDLIKLEAEDAVRTGGELRNHDNANFANADYSGTGYVAGFDNGAGTVTFTVESSMAGSAEIAIRYNTADNRSFNVSVAENGFTTVAQCNGFGGWNKEFATTTVTVNLVKGKNTITFSSVGANNAPSLDYISVNLPEKDIVYQLTEQMTAVDVLNYTVDATGADGTTVSVPGIIYIVPATVMYYEDNFKAENGNNWINYVNGANYEGWNLVGTTETEHQEAGLVGAAANIYGTDDVYEKDTGDSNGTSMHVTTSATKPAEFSYTFKGTGTTFFARTNDNSAYMKVVISDANGNAFYTYYRDTRYLDKNDAALDNGKTLYNIPVFSWDAVTDSNLGYGEYTVTVTLAKEVKIEGEDVIVDGLTFYGTDFWLDGIRVFNPLDESPLTAAVAMAAEDEMMSRAVVNTDLAEAQRVNIATNAYIADKEANPDTNTVREKLLADYGNAEGNWALKNGLTNVTLNTNTFTDTKAAIDNAMEYWLRGPKEEVYLSAGQSVTIYLKKADLDNAKVHLGVKIPFDGTGTITVNNQTITANGAVDCYYDITNAAKSAAVSDWYAVTITAGSNAGLVSLTNLKVTMTNGYEILSVN